MAAVYEQTPLLQDLFADTAAWIECYEHYNRMLWEQYNHGKIDSDFLRVERFVAPLREAGCDPDLAVETARTLDPLYLNILAECPAKIDGINYLMDILVERGYHIGVLSNGFRGIQEKKLATAGVDNSVECIVLSEDINVTKPDRQIFDHAMKMAGNLNPEAHLMIGDNHFTDIVGAVNAGWLAIHLDPERHYEGTFRHNVTRVDSLSQVADFLPQIDHF